MFEKITVSEQRMMTNYIEYYATSDGSFCGMKAPLNYILREWESAKSLYLERMFGGELILERKIDFVKDSEEIIQDLMDAFEDDWPHCLKDLRAMFANARRNAYNKNQCGYTQAPGIPACLESLSVDALYQYEEAVDTLVSYACLADNIYSGETVQIPLPAGGVLKVNKGCRATKMLGKLIAAFGLDMEDFENFRITHSRVLNQKREKGILCLSIHPLDFMTMSDNGNSWSSCMSWEDHGCYRQGTVEMMNSPCVVVAYLKSDKDMMMPHNDHWSNKKWRELFIVHRDIIANVKGYPYCNENLSKMVIHWLSQLAEAAGIGQYTIVMPYDTRDYEYTGCCSWIRENKIVISFDTNYMYNDFGHDHQWCALRAGIHDEEIEINYSGNSECMICGEINPRFSYKEGAECLACDNCNAYTICDCCGEAICHSDDAIYIEYDDCTVCRACYEEYYIEDDLHGEFRHIDDMWNVRICNLEETEYYDDWRLSAWIPADTSIDTISKSGNIIYSNDARNQIYVRLDDVTDELRECFHFVHDSDDAFKRTIARNSTSPINWR